MNAKLLLATVAVAAISTSAFAQDTTKVIWGGGELSASVYSSVYVPRIKEVLEQNRMAGYEWGGVSAGTVENALKVTENPTNLAVGQWDILKSLNGQPIPNKPGEVYDFTVLAEDIGPECLYVVTDQAGYDTFGHVLGNAWDMTIATGKDGSGSLATLQLLQGIYPDLGDALVQQVGSAADIVNAVKTDPAITHGFFVMRPDPASETFKLIKELDLHLVPVVDLDLESTYQFLDLKVAYGGFMGLGGNDQYLTTACTSVALITGTPAGVDPSDTRTLRRVTETIARIGAIDPEVLKPNLSTWRDMWDSIKITAGAKAKEMMEASKVAFEDIVDSI